MASIPTHAVAALALAPAFFGRRPPARALVAAASHGILDAFTDGGLGVAFVSPFVLTRWFFPWRPIRVSPIGVGAFFTHRGLAVLSSELRWVWLPAIGLAAVAVAIRWRSHTSEGVRPAECV